MIGLDFVKTIDKDWRKHITFSDGSPYYDDYCPLSGSKCRREDCSFWNDITNVCGYLTKDEKSIEEPKLNLEKNIDTVLSL